MERVAAYQVYGLNRSITFGLYIWRFNPKKSKVYT